MVLPGSLVSVWTSPTLHLLTTDHEHNMTTNTDNMTADQTPTKILSTAEELEVVGRRHAVSHFERGNFLDSPNEEVQKWLDRNHITPEPREFDRLYDAYCKGFQSYHVERWIEGLSDDKKASLAVSVSSDKELLREATEALEKAVAHLDYCGYGDKWERECAGNLPHELEATLKKLQSATR